MTPAISKTEFEVRGCRRVIWEQLYVHVWFTPFLQILIILCTFYEHMTSSKMTDRILCPFGCCNKCSLCRRNFDIDLDKITVSACKYYHNK